MKKKDWNDEIWYLAVSVSKFNNIQIWWFNWVFQEEPKLSTNNRSLNERLNRNKMYDENVWIKRIHFFGFSFFALWGVFPSNAHISYVSIREIPLRAMTGVKWLSRMLLNSERRCWSSTPRLNLSKIWVILTTHLYSSIAKGLLTIYVLCTNQRSESIQQWRGLFIYLFQKRYDWNY